MTYEKPPKYKAPQLIHYIRHTLLPCVRCGKIGKHDPHHLPNPFGGSRRAVDCVVPLCRPCHNWIQHTPEGIGYEQESLPAFYGEARRLYEIVYDDEPPWVKSLDAPL